MVINRTQCSKLTINEIGYLRVGPVVKYQSSLEKLETERFFEKTRWRLKCPIYHKFGIFYFMCLRSIYPSNQFYRFTL